MKKIRLTIWNEFRHEKKVPAVTEIYPEGIHNAIAAGLAAEDLEIRCAALDDPEQGLPQELLENTDVLMWWGHCAHHEVHDELVARIRARILSGMGLIVLHSGHYSKIFRTMMGTECRLNWRESGEKERIWTVNPSHPIARGLPETFVVPHTEMYGEPFNLPGDAETVFLSWYEGGNVLRSGVCFRRDNGRIFYFAPGHETFPIYRQQEVLQVLGNAVRWAAPEGYYPIQCTQQPEALEPIRAVSTAGSISKTR